MARSLDHWSRRQAVEDLRARIGRERVLSAEWMRMSEATPGSALAAVLEHLVAGIPAGWTVRTAGALAGVTGVAIPTLNGVWAYGADADPEPVSAFLDRIDGAEMAYCLQFSRDSSGHLAELAERRGMSREADIPLMVLEGEGDIAGFDVGELAIDVLEPEHAAVHAELAAAGFDAPVDAFLQVTTPAVLGRSGVRTYVGSIAGDRVVTGVGVHLDSCVGIFNIATLPGYRRRGYGAALTARAVRDGFAQGASWAWLQSTPAGYGVYEALGFRTVESWECWIAP